MRPLNAQVAQKGRSQWLSFKSTKKNKFKGRAHRLSGKQTHAYDKYNMKAASARMSVHKSPHLAPKSSYAGFRRQAVRQCETGDVVHSIWRGVGERNAVSGEGCLAICTSGYCLHLGPLYGHRSMKC